MKKIIVANWKMNPESEAQAEELLKELKKVHEREVELVICPPFQYLVLVDKKAGFRLGAQDIFWEDKGAYTGEVSSAMLEDLGVSYVIVGHSERRKWLGETDKMINKKLTKALKAGLHAILCVGEPIETRTEGTSRAKHFIGMQLEEDLKGVKDDRNLIIAYEPVWAIGTGKSDNPEDALDIVQYIKESLASRGLYPKVLYGGSVNSKNAATFLSRKEIDGALVGGASLDMEEFKKIVKIAESI